MKLTLSTGALRVQALLIVGIFLTFVLNALGVLSFDVMYGSTVAFRTHLLKDFLFDGGMPSQWLGLDVLAFLFAGIFLCALLPGARPIKASLLTLAASVPAAVIAYVHAVPQPMVPMEYTLWTILILFSFKVLVSYFIETHDKETIIAVFGRYVPREVANAIGHDPKAFSLALEGEARDLTVLFSDIKNFSGISEHLEPRELAQMLNTYFTEMTQILHKHGATIDKYIGDAIMVFWGAPVTQEDHSQRALHAALAMQAAMRQLRESFPARGWPRIEVGIGINSGVTNVGNMGSRYRIAYTAVGDAVNLAARLEGLTRLYGAQIVVSESTMAANPDILFRELDHVRVRGKVKSTRIFEPVCYRDQATAETFAWLAKHQAALDDYYGGRWDEARRRFEELGATSDTPRYYEILSRRAAAYAREVPVDWQGISSLAAEYTLQAEHVSSAPANTPA